jgi:hypothetical protein
MAGDAVKVGTLPPPFVSKIRSKYTATPGDPAARPVRAL